MFRKRLTILIVAVSMMSCNSLTAYPTATPLPGWNSPVTDLFVELTGFPEGWGRDPNAGANAVDVRVNNVSRTFFNLIINTQIIKLFGELPL
jgi:hypothetical protein